MKNLNNVNLRKYYHDKKTKLPVILIIMLYFAIVLQIIGQNNQILKGKVIGINNEPLIGATIREIGTDRGTVTNIDGDFSLPITLGSQIQISYVGYKTQIITITSYDEMVIKLEEDRQLLDEVVVVGYGTQKRINLTGAVTSISSKELEGKPVVNVVEALQGTTPGLIIQQQSSQPGARLGIRIRGERTMNDNNPLVIVDGIINEDIQNVNPSDIESISILKDAASTAIYGSRASNGVILITTKKGMKGKVNVQYDFINGIQTPTFLPNIVDSWVYAELRNEALVNSGKNIRFTPEEIRDFRENGPNINWMKEIYRDSAPQQTHNLSVNGGNENTSYLLSVGYMDQNSLFKGDDYGHKRFNTRLNLETWVSKKLRLNTNLSYVRNKIQDHAYWTEWIIEQATRMPPIYPIKDENDNYTLPSGSNSNALARLEIGGYRQNKNDALSANVSAEYIILEGLSIKGMIGGKLNNDVMHENRKAIPNTGDQEYRLTEDFGRTQNIIGNMLLTYDKKIENHSFGILAGYSYEGFNNKRFQTYRIDQKEYDILVGEQRDNVGNVGWASDWTLHSIFYRLTYNYKDRYMFEFNGRHDWSSRFSPENRHGFFPSISAGWNVAEEEFFANFKQTIPFMKIRTSFGLSGNNNVMSGGNIDNYQYLAGISILNGYNFGSTMVPIANYTVYNPDIKWETTSAFNIGTDIAFFNNALRFTVDYFNENTYDILVNLPLTGLYGYGRNFPAQNAAKVRNRGWELSAEYNFKTGSVNHLISGRIYDSQNKVIDMKGTERIDGFDVNTILKEGYPMFSYYAYKWDGIFQNEEEVQAGPRLDGITPKPGDLRYIDKNGDGLVKESDDRFVLGNRLPRYNYGFNYGLNWKRLDFSMLWQGVGMRNVWLRGEAVEAFHNNNEGPVFDFHIDRWTPNNPNATYPRLTVGAESANNAAKSEFWIDDAAYLRLENIQVGYTFPQNFTNKLSINYLRVFASLQNALTFTQMKGGWDPETADGSGRIYPVNRIFAFGLNVKF